MTGKMTLENGTIYGIDVMDISRNSSNKIAIFGTLNFLIRDPSCSNKLDTEENIYQSDCATYKRLHYKLSRTLSPYGGKLYKKIISNDPATIVIWNDGTKTVVKCQDGESYDKEKGVAMCFMKKFLGNKSNFNNVFRDCGALNEGVKDE